MDLKETIRHIVFGEELVEKKKLDAVDKDELKGDHEDREDKDIDNDGDSDESDEYLHKRRKAVGKSIKQAELDENYAIYYKGDVFDTFASKKEAQDSLNGMDLSAAEKKEYKIRKGKGSGFSGKNMKEELVGRFKNKTRNEELDLKFEEARARVSKFLDNKGDV